MQKKPREAILPVITFFWTQYDRYKGFKTAHATIAVPLSDDLITKLEALTQAIAPCQEVTFVQHIEPTILGGFILQVDDKRLDKSLLTKLYALKKQYITTAYV